MAQSGDTEASQTPKGDVTAPARPITTPSLTRHVLFRTWEMAPDIDVGMIVKSDVAVQAIALMW